MWPIEVYFGTIALIVLLIGLARGYARELGSSMIILVAIFLLLILEERLNPILLRVRSVAVGEETVPDLLFLSLFYQILFVVVVFASYAGRTITFAGSKLTAPQGTILDILIGLINGYLIAGTLWYLQNEYDYPFQALGLATEPLTQTGEAFVGFLPQYVMPQATLWMIPIAILLLIRVRG